MKSIINFRRLGSDVVNQEGKRIKEDMIFRCGNPDFIQDEDRKRLIEEFKVNHVFDFRTEEEASKESRLKGEDIQVYNFNILRTADPRKMMGKIENLNTAVERMDRMYEDDFGVTKGYIPVIEKLQQHLGEPFLFHCSAGRDRTGIMGAILMMIFDFDEEAIVQEYLKCDIESLKKLGSSLAQRMNIDPSDGFDKEFERFIRPAESQIRLFLNRIKKDYGTFDSYLEEVYGLNQMKKEEFKQGYLR